MTEVISIDSHDAIDEQLTVFAERNLRSLHPWLTKLFSKHVLSTSGYKIHEPKGSPTLINLNQELDEQYLHVLKINISEVPMHQSSISEVHWIRFMMELMSHNYKVTIRKNYKTDNVKAYLQQAAKHGQGGKFYEHNVMRNKVFSHYDDATLIKVLASLGQNEKLSQYWPLKKATAVNTKTNLFLDDLIASLKKYNAPYYDLILRDIPYCIGISNDQMTCLLISHSYLWTLGHCYRLKHYAHYIFNHELVKAISDFTKLMGVADNAFLGLYSEADSLFGRGAVEFNLQNEVDELSARNAPRDHNIIFKAGEIYQEAIRLFETAMPIFKNYTKDAKTHILDLDIDTYWKNRHVNCVNGAHHLPTNSGVADVPTGLKKTRMVWLENTKVNPMFKTKPIIEASLSLKYENPKVRPIKSQDTLSYLCEDFIMKRVEKFWAHSEVLLDPALSTKAAEAQRVRNMLGDEYVMLDYAAMDKQHSLRSQYELKKALYDYIGLNDDYAKWLLEAEENQFIRTKDGLFKMRYSLLTGRRTTTFINSCLNYIYLNIGLGNTVKLVASRYHAGDDIILRCKNRDDARVVINQALRSKSIFNIRKQSWGKSGEFLRHSVGERRSQGYLCRSIAAFVCGSWVNDLKLSGGDVAGLYARYAWTMDTRGLCKNVAGACLAYSLHKRTGLSLTTCYSITTSRCAVNGGPCRPSGQSTFVLKPKIEIEYDELPTDVASYASNDYVGMVAKPLSAVLSDEDLGRLRNIFRKASYAKALVKGYKTVDYTIQHWCINEVEVNLDYKIANDAIKGVVAQHPTLPSIRGMLSVSEMNFIASVLANKRYDAAIDYETWLWGANPGVIITNSTANYDDLCQIAKVPYYHYSSPTAVRAKFPFDVCY